MKFLDRAQTFKAAVESVRGRRRRAHEYRRWALEAEAANKLDDYRRFRKLSDEQWRGAWDSLNTARANHGA